ncbi:zinc finger protein 318-like [Orcinus orca]|uniref:zinc finger protein 318-like n=1 Tax=Orcinus orca TaxID=9733 RepID=UPI00211281C0|nr:zinc finger protein 318-like [Orcinus orca]
MARGAPPSGRSPVPGCSGLRKLPESSPGRQASSSPPPRSLDRGRPWRGRSLQPQSRRPHNPPCAQSRRAAVRTGAGPGGERGSVCVCSCVCVDADARGTPGGSGGGGLSTPATYSSARRQRGRAGQFQEPAAASRALADTGKACDWPAAAPMQTS